MGERGDIIKTMHREMAREGLYRAPSYYAIFDTRGPGARRPLGRVVARGLSDESNDRHYLIVDGIGGRAHYVDIGKADATEPLPDDAIVAIAPKRAAPREVDRTIAEVAAANDGRYGVDIHLRHDATATAAFAETHVRRLEAMRRRGIGVERKEDGTWTITPDHLDRAAAYERSRVRASPVVVEMLSAVPLDRQIGAEGATWLDRELVADAPSSLRDTGFGREVRQALDQRRHWLLEQELARPEQDRMC